MKENKGLHSGKVFQISLRNANIKAESIKGGWRYRFIGEMTAEDFDQFNGHDLTGSLFEATLECVEISQSEPKPIREKGGSLSISAARICEDRRFQEFLEDRDANTRIIFTDSAADYVRKHCGVESRAMIDHDENAKHKFKELMAEYGEWLGANMIYEQVYPK